MRKQITPEPTIGKRPRPWWRRPAVLWAYLALLAVSNLVQSFAPDEWFRLPSVAPSHVQVALPAHNPSEAAVRLGFLEWGEQRPSPASAPVILLHGCPGQANDYAELGPLLAAQGRRVYALDLLGFNESEAWVEDYSFTANAEAVLEFMDAKGIDRAHLVGWSNSGGVVLHMADVAPERCASITLLAAIGAQENEGSGDYAFEQFKYRVAYAAAVVGAEAIPHFGLLGKREFRHASVRFFMDSDQRPLRDIMARLKTPALVLHGRDDFLVHDWAAEEHHRLMPTSRLVMLDANHFIPFLQAQEAAGILGEFFARHDKPGVQPLTGATVLAPEDAQDPLPVRDLRQMVRGDRVWGVVALLAAAAALLPLGAAVVGGVLVTGADMDIAVLATGLLLGGVARGAAGWVRGSGAHTTAQPEAGTLRHAARLALSLARIAIGALATSAVVVGADALIFGPARREFGWAGVLLTAAGLPVIVRVVPLLFSRRGRAKLAATPGRLLHHEYWPAWLFYAPLAPYILLLACRHRGLFTPTCCNPGIENGGGLVGESKTAILRAIAGRPEVLPTALVPPGTAEQRAAFVAENVERGAGFEWPVILKPDAGQRGFGVRLVKSEDDAARYFSEVTTPVVMQRFHPGPMEFGILWARDISGPDADGSTGFIYSITAKEFPAVTGDGVRTLERLILRDRRLRRQASVFLARMEHRLGDVPAKGERVPLAVSGNHCQGTLFKDGSHLITPELTATINRIALSFRGRDGGGFDIGRFDVRCADEESLRRGEGLAIVELNGTTGESTNIYDPHRSVFWAYRVLFGQWRLLYEIGAWRRSRGATPMTLRELLRLRHHYAERRGSAIAD